MNNTRVHKSVAFFLTCLPYAYWLLLLFAMAHGVAYADSTDYLKGADTSIAGTFGDNTTFEHVLYVVEACAGAIGYIKTKSYMVLIGLPVLMIATHFFFKMVAPAA